jgi:hypothetical protein
MEYNKGTMRVEEAERTMEEANDWNFPCQTLKISKVSRVVIGS